jgi:hypothetical protein
MTQIEQLPAELDLRDTVYLRRFLKRPKRKVWQLLKDGRIPGAIRIDHKWMVPLSEIRKIAKNGLPAAGSA